MIRWVIVMVLAASALTAHAGPRRTTTAQALSGVGTGVSSALVLSSFLFRVDNGEVNRPLLYSGLASSVITPSLGEWYAGEWLTIGMGVRAAAALLAGYGVTRTQETRCLAPGVQSCKELTGWAAAVLGVAAIAFIGGAAYDVMDADDAARRHNAKHATTVTPYLFDSGGGIELGGWF